MLTTKSLESNYSCSPNFKGPLYSCPIHRRRVGCFKPHNGVEKGRKDGRGRTRLSPPSRRRRRRRPLRGSSGAHYRK